MAFSWCGKDGEKAGQGGGGLPAPASFSASPEGTPEALRSPLVGDTGAGHPQTPRPEAPAAAAALTEADVVGEELQEALALVLPVPAGVAGAPGSDAGRGVVDVVGGDGAACRDRWTMSLRGRDPWRGRDIPWAPLLGDCLSQALHDSSRTLQVLTAWLWFAPREEKRSTHNPFGHITITKAFGQLKSAVSPRNGQFVGIQVP